MEKGLVQLKFFNLENHNFYKIPCNFLFPCQKRNNRNFLLTDIKVCWKKIRTKMQLRGNSKMQECNDANGIKMKQNTYESNHELLQMQLPKNIYIYYSYRRKRSNKKFTITIYFKKIRGSNLEFKNGTIFIETVQ